MKVIMTAREIMDKGLWMEFCELRGINEWAVNEGLMDSDEEFVLNEREIKKLHLQGIEL
jgi:hypothetical protein